MPAISFIKLKRIIIENSLARALAATYDTFFRNVILLLHGNGNNAGQNNTFVDNSANNFAITRNGNVTQGTFSPYGDNWSVFLTGSSGYLSTTNNANLNIANSDFTFECWANGSSFSTDWATFFGRWGGNGQYGYFFSYDTDGGLTFIYSTNGSAGGNVARVYGGTMTTGQWHHVAFCRSGGTTRAFLDGIQIGASTSDNVAIFNSNGQQTIGGVVDGGTLYHPFNGYISNLRLVIGTALYTSNFTPSSAPLAVIPNTRILTCASNRFVDRSATAITISLVGNPSIQRFSPFQLTTPYSSGTSGQSVYFDGNGDYLRLNPGSAFAFGTDDFTVEAWVYPTAQGATAQGGIYLIDARNASQTNAWLFGTNLNDVVGGAFRICWSDGATDMLTTSAMTEDAWNHVVYVRSGTTGSLFLNGIRAGTKTDSKNYNISPTQSTIGSRYDGTTYQVNGYLSNIRVVKGTAVYNPNQTSFSVPITPLTAIANTVLLTCQSDSFVDTSPNNFTITPNGNAAIRLFSPFSSVAQLGSVGGSAYFDGTDNLSIASAAGLCDFAAGEAFTFQTWIYRIGTGSMIFIQGGSQTFQISLETGSGGFTYSKPDVAAIIYGSGSCRVGEWTHCTVCRNTNNVSRIWVNGISVGSTTTDTYSFNTAATYIGSNNTSNSGFVNGYLSDMRIVKGQAIYDPTSSANIVIPSAPLTAIPNTSFLLNFTNATIIDNSMMNDLETLGNAQISTSVKKYGSGSLAFDGTGDYLAIQRFENSFNIRTEKFTIEGWFYLTNSTFQVLFASGNTGLGNLYLDTSGTDVYFGDGASNIIVFPTSNIPANSWFHLAVTFDGTTYRIFINGVSVGSSTTLLKNVTLSDFYIAARPGTFNKIMVSGYIDDFRITKGVARYISNFTPPTVQFPDIGAIKVIDPNQIATFSDIEITTFGNDNIFKIT